MRSLARVGGFIVVSLLAPLCAAAQIPSPDNLYVLQATARQATTTAPLTLTFSEPLRRNKRTVNRTEVTIPAADVIDSLTIRVRAAGSAFVREPLNMFLFVLDVRSTKLSTNGSESLVLTLGSGAVVMVPASCVHVAATRWLRVNLPSVTSVSASTAPVNEPNKSDAPRPPDQGSATGSSVQFDAKGVDFSPWLRRFISQIRRNWFVPESAREAKGRVVVTFRVHKSGAITHLAVVTPASVEAFNSSAFSAVAASNPTYPLPPEYPDEYAVFTVTFDFNENPGDA